VYAARPNQQRGVEQTDGNRGDNNEPVQLLKEEQDGNLVRSVPNLSTHKHMQSKEKKKRS